mgnify:CR=1 FL=1
MPHRNGSPISRILLAGIVFATLQLFAQKPSPALQTSHPFQYDNLELGIPGKTDALINRDGYAVGFSDAHKQAVFVIYKLTKMEVITKNAKRSNRFRADPEIPNGSATPEDYRKSGFDRGHLASAADMAWSVKTMEDSFLMSNMSPQKPAFNRGIWARLEAQVRAFAVVEEEVFVVTGAILPKEKTVTVGESGVTAPFYFYKVVYDLTPPQKMIAFVLPNEGSKCDLREFAVTVDAVEELTGLDFFSLVPKEKQDRLESTITITDWSWGEVGDR